MSIERLRELRLAHPFQPFYLLLENGDKLFVDKPYHFGMAPDGSRMGVLAPDGMRLINPASIKDVEIAMAAK